MKPAAQLRSTPLNSAQSRSTPLNYAQSRSTTLKHISFSFFKYKSTTKYSNQ
ncbi:Hypothetical protein FKW44_008217, partial [Caligus rogercresseyi]